MIKQIISFFILIISTTCLAQRAESKMIATIFNKFDGKVSKQELIEKCKIEIISKHQHKYKIVGFKFTTVVKGGFKESDESNSDTLTSKMKDLITSLRFGKEIFFHNIIAEYKKDTVLLNSIRLILNDINDLDTIEYSFNKATFAGLIDGFIDTSAIKKVSRIDLVEEGNNTKILEFGMDGSPNYEWGSLFSSNEELTIRMKSFIRTHWANSFIYIYKIRILENNKIKQIPPIFIEIKKP